MDYLKRLLGRRYQGLPVDTAPPQLLDPSQLRGADVLFCRGGEKHIPWQIISSGSSGSYVHVAIYIGQGQVAESTMEGVIQSSLASLVDRYKYVVVTRCAGAVSDPAVQSSVVAYCQDHAKKKTKYDLVGAVLSPIFELLDLAHQRIRVRSIDFNWPRRKDRTFCSQFALDAFVPSGYIQGDFYAMGARSPTALAEENLFDLVGFLSNDPNLYRLLSDDVIWTGGG